MSVEKELEDLSVLISTVRLLLESDWFEKNFADFEACVDVAAPKVFRLLGQVVHMAADMQVDVTLKALQRYESEGGLTKNQAIALLTKPTSFVGSAASVMRSSVGEK